MNEEKTIEKDLKEKSDFMLTTIDNPYDPYTQFQFWYGFDTSKRIIPQVDENVPVSTDCCAYLAREAITSYDMTDEEAMIERHRAIDEIIRLDPFHIYVKAYPKDHESK